MSQQRRWLQGCGSWLVRQRGLHARWSRSLLLGHLQSQRHQHSCQAGPGPRGPWRHCLLIKLRPGSKHSSSAASPPARLQTRVKPSTARGRGLEAPWRHSARGGSTGAPTLGLSGSNPPSTAGATGFRPCSADTPHAKEQPSPSPATTGPAQLRKPPAPWRPWSATREAPARRSPHLEKSPGLSAAGQSPRAAAKTQQRE